MPRGSGRRPKPTKLKKLTGNAGKRALNEKEPTPPAIAPDMPDGLSKVAQQEWKSIVPQLERLGVLSRIDGKALAAYCHAFARWFEAEEEIAEYGIVVKEPVLLMGAETGFYRHKKNPAVTISEGAMKLMKSFLIEFGMTPASRSRLRVDQPAGDEQDPFEKFMKGRNKSSENKHVN
jgi:P27 family predicted phage terminase small subunit